MDGDSESNGLRELLAALLEERQTIAVGVARLREARRRKGTFVPGDGAAAGPRIVAIQEQIAVVEAILARPSADDEPDVPE